VIWKLASYNVNGIRARIATVIDWATRHDPDVLCLQEIKCQEKDFPFQPFHDAGYQVIVRGQKSFNGVAILTKKGVDEINREFGDGEPDEEARFLAVRSDGVWVVNTYVPQGRRPEDPAFQHKLHYFQRLKRWFSTRFQPDHPLIWTGDLNVAPADLDVYDPKRLEGSVGFHPLEKTALASVASWGFTDLFRKLHPDQKQFTFWDYRLPKSFERNLGWRLDHIMVTRAMEKRSITCLVDSELRGKTSPSDHAPIWAEFAI
jgi:exodeoxyribonuclease III